MAAHAADPNIHRILQSADSKKGELLLWFHEISTNGGLCSARVAAEASFDVAKIVWRRIS
jgi:hypothetical protein